jgi:N-acetylmuramoyl-L-alanine amidase
MLVVTLFTLPSLTPLAAKEARTIAKGARLGGDESRTEFVAELSRKVAVEVFTLGNPYRVIVDLPEVQFKFPAGEGRSGKGLVTAYRFGTFAPGKSRIVIDVKAPVQVETAAVEDARDGQPVRLVVSLTKTGEAEFQKTLAARRAKEASSAVAQPAAVEAPQDKSADRKDPRPLIVLDAGHGGIDSGAIGNGGTLEKDVVLAFSKLLKGKIEVGGRFRVKLTREIDTYIPLHERVRISRAAGADLFISIHADSLPRRKRRMQVRGASVYVLSERASDEEAQELASSENRADIIAGVELPDSEDPVTGILIDLAQRETNGLSALFGQLQIKQMKGVVPMHGDFTRSAGFRVLKAPDVPSVLIELGYISSPHDEKSLTSDKWLDSAADTVQKSVASFFSTRIARNPF